METIAKPRVDPFANGFEERNPIVAKATRVTLGATRCMFGTCIASAVEIKEKTTIENIGMWTYGFAINWRIGASSNPLVVVGIDEGQVATIKTVWYRWGTSILANWLAKKWWIHTKLIEYSTIVTFCLVQQQIHDLSLLVTCPPSSKHDGVVYISASSSKCWVLDVGALKPKSCMNWSVVSCKNQGCNGALGVMDAFCYDGTHLKRALWTNT